MSDPNQPSIMTAFKKKRPSNGGTATTDRKNTQAPATKSSSFTTVAGKRDSSPTPTPVPASAQHKMSSPTATAEMSTKLQVTESIGDIFSAPNNSLLIHGCNCQASWSAGIAKAFKDHYPKAFQKKWTPDQLFGTAQLITPPNSAFPNSNATPSAPTNDEDEGFADDDADEAGDPETHFVGCLYTSRRYGKGKDTPKRILEATKPAMEDLLRKVKEWNDSVDENRKMKEVRMCKINSGLFNVPWEKTKEVLESIEVEEGGVAEVKVISLE
ncbi:ADP-ribose 1''-phosphate phosphatase [Saxophila tyrrhenica]|uniref:ADP-ribose 1''-phosphate phosphatase n=1 Tax=Saxophila tyrrhenica TaxID=1690608 RepID=A0AAV9NZM5_9PEZI|nr:ADP-ribose 1''-phosphate phosphatase [Saxophila tyrrhenica]